MPGTRQTPLRLRLDDQGHAIPLTPEERAVQLRAVQQMFEELAQIPDDPNEPSDSEIFRAIDSYRPHRPLFEDYY